MIKKIYKLNTYSPQRRNMESGWILTPPRLFLKRMLAITHEQ